MSGPPPGWAVVAATYILDHFASIVTAVLTIAALFRLQVLHVLVNSRLTQLLEASRAAERAEGKAEGAAAERARRKEKP